MSVRKYVTFNTAERSVAGGGSGAFSPLAYEAPEDQTVVGVVVEVALSMESLEPALGYEHNNIGGFARLVIRRAGEAEITPVANGDWDAVGGAGNLNDADAGDTWAMTPFALSSSGNNSTPGHATNDRIILVPKTKRKLRRQDTLSVQLFYTNSGDDTGTIQEVTCGTLFVMS